MELQSNIINLNRRINRQMNFRIAPHQLAILFEPDNIRHGDSIDALKEWGKLPGLEKLLRTSYIKGIPKDKQDHERRVGAYGDNQPVNKSPKTVLHLILQNFEDEMLRILCAAAVVSLVLGILTEGLAKGWMEGASILVAVVIIVAVTSGNNYMKEQQFQKLNAVAKSKDIYVYRAGELVKLSVFDLLVGDIVQITTGEVFSVDGILIEGSDVTVDESSLTGEPDNIKKKVPVEYTRKEGASPFLISSSKMMSGTGLMVVCAVGVNSYYGKLKLRFQQAQDETPLQIKLSDLAQKVGQVGMSAAALTFLAMFGHYLYDCYIEGPFVQSLVNIHTIHEIIEYFIIAVSIVVVAVPEGLPLSVTIALAYSVGKMKEENNLVRYLEACETMGGADNICSDKTGTLTKNLMTVTKVFVEEGVRVGVSKNSMNHNTQSLFCVGACVNSLANPVLTTSRAEHNGDKTECALLELAYDLGYCYTFYRRRDKILRVFPFNSERKKMATVWQDEQGRMFLFVKGAPDFTINSCSYFIDQNGDVSAMTQSFSKRVLENVDNFADDTLRTLLLCYRQVKAIPKDWSQIEKQLVVIALVGIKDPLRDGIRSAVRMCHEAGVTVRMVTGDNKKTAIAIAKQAGILPANWQPKETDYSVMEGKQFRQFVGGLAYSESSFGEQVQGVGNLENFDLVAKDLRVLARSSPEDKYLITTGLKQLDHVVAMTGDGTNDAPALKKADIGFAMGICGTEVAKEASGIILLDDNFVSIVTAMKWGRNIFDSIRKFLQFQLTVNFVALVMAFVGGAVLRQSPLNPIQMLWVNLIMDTLASLALATEPPSEELLKRKPYSKRESLITSQMWKFIICQGLLQIIILGVILFQGPSMFGIPNSIDISHWDMETGKHSSIFFNVFVLLQVFNEINARKLKADEYNVFENFFNNPLFLVIILITISIQIAMVNYGGQSLKTVPLSFKENLFCVVLGSMSLLGGLAFKIIVPKNLNITSDGIEMGRYMYRWSRPEDNQDQ